LSRPHVDKACDNRTDTYPDEPISPDTLAFLCKCCYDCLYSPNPEKQNIPTFSLANGVDYSLAYIYMPKLSFIGELMLLRSQLYGHVLKFGAGHGQYGLKGHLVSMETPAGRTVAGLADAHLKEATRIVMPRQQFALSLMYLGPMDKWDRICADKNSKKEFIQTFGKILSVKSEELLQWVQLLKLQFPNENIVIDENCNQSSIDNIIQNLFTTASLHDQDSIANQIDEQAHLNVPGADLHENRPEDDTAVEHAFVRIETNDNSLDYEEQHRQVILSQFQSKLLLNDDMPPPEQPAIPQV